MRALLPVALAALLGAPSLRADPPPPAEAAVALDGLRARFAAALDRASWRRDDPAVRPVADEVTAEALRLHDDVPALRDEARALAHEAAGEPLGAWLRRAPVRDDALVGAWLREHDDAELAASVASQEPPVQVAVAAEVAPRRPALAAELLRPSLRGPGGPSTAACAVALSLPAPLRASLAPLAAQNAHALPHPECLALVAEQPSLRHDLAARAERERAPQSGTPQGLPLQLALAPHQEAWPAVAAVMLLATAAPPLAARLRALFERRLADHVAMLGDLARAGPWLRPEHPAVAAALARFDGRGAGTPDRLTALHLRARDPRRVAALLRMAERPELVASEADGTARQLALMTPRRPDAVAHSAEALERARDRMRAYPGGDRDRVRSVDNWVDALRRTGRCADDACLRALLRSATDETAARAAWLLGPRGLAELPPDDAAALVRRLAFERPAAGGMLAGVPSPDGSALALAVYATLRDCPAALRGLADLGGPVAPVSDPMTPWRAELAARCHERGPR